MKNYSRKNYLGKERYVYSSISQSIDSFYVQRAGITYPDQKYNIFHPSKSGLMVVEYVISGKGYIETDQNKYLVQKGDCYLINQHATVHYYADKEDPYEKIWINIYGDLVNKINQALDLTADLIIVPCDIENELLHLHELVKNQYDLEKDDLPTLQADIKIAEAVLGLLIKISLKAQKPVSIMEQRAQQMKRYIDANLMRKFQVGELSELLHLSRPSVNNCFKEIYGITPHKYHINSKLKLASNLLLSSQHTVGEIAILLNFSDSQHFSKSFKNYFKLSPTQYREKYLKT